MRITALYTGILGLIYLLLSLRVVYLRFKTKTGLGCSVDMTSPLSRAVRIHANFFEYVPFVLFIILLNELLGSQPWILHGAGVTLIFARLFHIIGITKSHNFTIFRFWGTVLTFSLLLVLSILLIAIGSDF